VHIDHGVDEHWGESRPTSTHPLSWGEICELHPNEWVCLLDIDCEPNGSIRSARVASHDRSIERALDQIDPPNPDRSWILELQRRR
jgi:hypothetical protein